jgi:ketosteroid isomerase-like protein
VGDSLSPELGETARPSVRAAFGAILRLVLQENEETARRMLVAFNRNFADGSPDLYELLDPEVEWMPITAALEGTAYHGEDRVREWVEELRRDWEVFETRPEEYRDLGGERVLVIGTWRARGRGSGVELDSPQAYWLVHLRDSKVTRLRTFTDMEQAFEAAGLP